MGTKGDDVIITCAWVVDTGDPERIPWLLSAYDENTDDSNDGPPEDYKEIVKLHSGPEYLIRECTFVMPDSFLDGLFAVPECDARNLQAKDPG